MTGDGNIDEHERRDRVDERDAGDVDVRVLADSLSVDSGFGDDNPE